MHIRRAPIASPVFTKGTLVLLAIMAAGLFAAFYRLIFGLAASTNLTDRFPWGLWVALDIEGRVALSAGGFVTAALVHIFHREKYEPIVRSALVVALLGYTCAVLGLFLDLGRWYNIWHPAMPWMWQGNSVLFEVAMCVMAYLHVLYGEFVPAVCERFIGRVHLPGPLAPLNALVDKVLRVVAVVFDKLMFFLIIAGVVLSCMHQSALGSLILVAPFKTNPLWFTPVLPLLFLISAIGVGLPMVVFENVYASWAFGRKIPMRVLTPLSKIMVVLLGIYAIAKISDFMIREAYVHLFTGGVAPVMWCIEVIGGIFVPLGLLSFERVRRSPSGLFIASLLIVGGVLMNRLNVFLIAYRPAYTSSVYVPSVMELLTSAGLIAGTIFVYRMLVTIFPVLTEEEDSAAPDHD